MTFDEYDEKAKVTAIYPKASDWPPIYPILGLCGEVGELAGQVGVSSTELVLLECGDVLWYLSAFVRDLGSSLKEVARCESFAGLGAATDHGTWAPPNYAVLGLVFEVGSIAEKTKKILRDHAGVLHPDQRTDLLLACRHVLRQLSM